MLNYHDDKSSFMIHICQTMRICLSCIVFTLQCIPM
ncbi:hypothetical protein PARMER_01481 [Parabacteroides merdae ATCC 43184]|nr:hypothetical protein PARMER_01481 [Parabacteroides merdae ATCC 43184]